MTQKPDMSEMDAYYERTRKPLFRVPQSRLGRFIFGIVLVIWFAILLLPCGMMWLAFGNTITIPRSNVPEPELHPMLELQLVMEIDNRGLKITTSNVSDRESNAICLESHVTYLLWQSDSSAAPATYCQCYARNDESSPWQFMSQAESACAP